MWDKLSMKEKAAFIRTAVKNGVYNLDDIRNRYNKFAENAAIEETVDNVNKSKADFVNRLKDADRQYIKDWEHPGYIATHKLSVGTDSKGNNYIYPEVQNIDGKLVDFTRPPYLPYAGMISAEERGDTVRVPSIEQGVRFTENYKKYYPKGKTFAKGGHIYDGFTEDSQQMGPTFWGGTLPEVEVAAPRKWFVGYDENANPIYTTDYKQSQEYLQNQIPLSDLEQSRRQWAFETNGGKRLSTTNKNFLNAVGEVLQVPLLSVAPVGGPAEEGVEAGLRLLDKAGEAAYPILKNSPYVTQTMKFMGRPLTTFVEGAGHYTPKYANVVEKALPYLEGFDRSLMGTLGITGVQDATKKLISGEAPWAETIPEALLSGAMLTDLYPAAKGITLATKNGLEKLSSGVKKGYTAAKKFINDAYFGGVQDLYRKLYNLEIYNPDREEAYVDRMAREAQQDYSKFRDLVSNAYYARPKAFSQIWPDEATIGRNQPEVNFEKMSDKNILDFFTGKVDNPSKVAKSYDRSKGIFVMDEATPRAFNPEEAVTTGSVEIKDIETGKVNKFNLSLGDNKGTGKGVRTTYTPKDTPKRKEGISYQDIDNTAAKLNPEAPKEYTEAIQKNMDYVSNTILPGSRPFGSSTNIARGNLVHGSHDIDVIMTEAQAKKHKNFKDFYEKIDGATLGYTHPQAGEIDINIIREKGGKAYGQRAHELYAQLHPKEYRDIMMSYAKKGKTLTTDLPLDKTADELLKEYNPVTKGIMDAFGSSKSKHMKRAIYYLHYGDLADVRKGFDSYANYLLGGEYKPSAIPLEEFSNPEVNSRLIDELSLTAINKEQFINDPERMKLLFDYAMLDKTFVGRGVDDNVIKSLTYWYPENNGGTAMGVGLNTVRGGDSTYGSVYGTLIPERMPQPTSLSPMENIEKLKINRELEPEEIAKVKDLGNKHNIPLSENNLYDFTSILKQTEGKEGKNYKKFIAELAKEFDIPLIENDTFGNAPYASLLEDQPEEAIKQLILHGMDRPTPASARDREAFSNARTDFGKDLREAREAVNERNMLITKSRKPEDSLIKQLANKIRKRKETELNKVRTEARRNWHDQDLSHEALYDKLQENVNKYARRIKLIRNIVDGTAIGTLVGGGAKLTASALNSYGRKRDAKRNWEYKREIERRKQERKEELRRRSHLPYFKRLNEYKLKN